VPVTVHTCTSLRDFFSNRSIVQNSIYIFDDIIDKLNGQLSEIRFEFIKYDTHHIKIVNIKGKLNDIIIENGKIFENAHDSNNSNKAVIRGHRIMAFMARV